MSAETASCSTASPLRVLFVDDCGDDVWLSIRALEKVGYAIHPRLVQTREEFAQALSSGDYDLILCDYRLPGWNGADVLAVVRDSGMELPVVVVTGTLGEETAVEMIKLGAVDFVLKQRLTRLPLAIERALREKQMREERKRTEERLQLFGRILDSSTEAIAILTPDGYFSEQNAAHQRLTEYSIEELRGHTPALVVGDPLFREHWQELVSAAGMDREARIRTKSGCEKDVEISAFPILGDAGQVLRIVAIVRDISERRRLQIQLQQAAKMEAVGRLAGGVAHDFNNLLNVIIGYSELMMERRDSTEFLERGIREIRKAADRAAGLTRQLLAFSRQQVLELKVLDLHEVIAEMEDLLLRMLGEDVEFVFLPAKELGRVRADPGQIGQVLMNLAANSKDAMPQGGRFIVETANVLIDESFSTQHANMPPGSYVVLSISDTGCGMSGETRAHIFEPFFTTKEKGKGTGLGLATVYGIVKQSGGYIWVYSEPDLGATFKLYLPRVDAQPERLQLALTPCTTCQGSETLLVVEDEEGVRQLVRDYLKMKGYTVLEAGHGEEALRIAGGHSGAISLMITDVVMPGMNGRELAERMAILRPAMKVLYMSGYAETAVYRKGVLDPGVPFLQKPFSPPDLGRKVRDVLGPEQEASLLSKL
ncbi:MAG TPA: response regulator [Terriglobales bacterium]|nr:response regulator [Terriglobales bacterium]